MIIKDFSVIPDILMNVSPDSQPQPWGLRSIGEMLELSYNLLNHPIFNGSAIQDYFTSLIETPERFKLYNRTVVERIINDTKHYGEINFEFGTLTMRSEGVENALITLKLFLHIANELISDISNEQNNSAVWHFQITQQGALHATIMYFLDICQTLILNIRCTMWSLEYKKIHSQKERNEFLQRKKADLHQAKIYTDEKIYSGLVHWIDIEVDYLKNTQDDTYGLADLKPLIEKFLKQQKARTTNDDLLRHLLRSEIDLFCSKLSEMVKQVFSYHDISGKEPEKVYHAFLLGILNGLQGQYRIESNKEAGLGRFDIIAIPDLIYNDGIIIEVKKLTTNRKTEVQQSLKNALSQIHTKQYGVELKLQGTKRYVAIACAFYGKEVFLNWEIKNLEV